MKRYSVKEVCEILDIKQHVLRYWEEQVALITPERSDSGHRRWSSDQLNILRRLKHLIVDRGMSVHGAEEQIIRESSGPVADRKMRIAVFRDVLESIRTVVPSDEKGSPADSYRPVKRDDPLSRGLIPSPSHAGVNAPVIDDWSEPEEAVIRSAVVSLQHLVYRSIDGVSPELVETASGETILSVTAPRLRNHPWIIAVRRSNYGRVLDYLDGKGWFGLKPGSVFLLPLRTRFRNLRYSVSSEVAALIEILENDALKLWLEARQITALSIGRAFDLRTDLLDGNLLKHALKNPFGYAAYRRAGVHLPAAIYLPSFFYYGSDLVETGVWDREITDPLNSRTKNAENGISIWKYAMYPPESSVAPDSPIGSKLIPPPWSIRWPMELDLLIRSMEDSVEDGL